MNTVDRLHQFLEAFAITKSQFADKCDIPRPTASQILSGRIKRISDDIICKIHKEFPQLSISWLMFGEGEMLVDGATIPAPAKPSENSIFDDESYATTEYAKENDPKINLNDSFVAYSGKKYITKLVVFYSDSSFEEFHKL